MDTKSATAQVVLVADDNPDTRALVAASLTQLGLTIRECGDGSEATALCRESLPDLAILDGKMPGMNGVDVCKVIKSLPGGELVPVIMLTALDRVEDKVKALESGADDYLTKPFHYQELQARVHALLRVRELNSRLHATNTQLRAMQDILLHQERQLVVSQIAGTAAHQLGQPLSAIMLNCYLLETLPQTDERFKKAVKSIVSDSKKMAGLIDRLKDANVDKRQSYHGDLQILDIDE